MLIQQNTDHGARLQFASYEALVAVHKVRPNLVWRLCRLRLASMMRRRRRGRSGLLRDRERRERDDGEERKFTLHIAS
jgi:hypothetical protein